MTNSDVSEITAFLLPLSEPYKFKSELLGQVTESHSSNRMNWAAIHKRVRAGMCSALTKLCDHFEL